MELLKVGILKTDVNPGITRFACSIPELRICYSWLEFFIIPTLLRYIRLQLPLSEREKMPSFSSRQFWRCAWVFLRKNSFSNQIARVFASVFSFSTSAKLIRYITSVPWALVWQTIDFIGQFNSLHSTLPASSIYSSFNFTDQFNTDFIYQLYLYHSHSLIVAVTVFSHTKGGKYSDRKVVFRGNAKRRVESGGKRSYGDTIPPSLYHKHHVVQCDIIWQYGRTKCLFEIQKWVKGQVL